MLRRNHSLHQDLIEKHNKAIEEYEKVLQFSHWYILVSNLATSYYLIGEKE